MMRCVAVLCAVLGVALAHKCCTPAKYESTMLSQRAQVNAGKGQIVADGNYIAYDREMGMEVVYPSIDVKRLTDYVNGIVYNINYTAKSCETVTAPKIDRGCIPDTATELGSTVKATGNKVNAYQYTVDNMAVSIEMDELCLPQVLSLSSANGSQAYYEIFIFTNTSLTISDSHAFDVPEFCSLPPELEVDPTKCCAPAVFQSTLMHQIVTRNPATQQPIVSVDRLVFASDRTKGREVAVSSDGSRTIMDTANKMRYFVNGTTCKGESVPLMTPRGCLPSGQKLTTMRVEGGQLTQVFNMIYDGKNTTMQIGTGCEVHLTTQSSKDEGYYLVSLTGDFKASVDNPSAFDIPSSCGAPASVGGLPDQPGVGK